MKIALIGNQNSGKTTLFNCLTGANQKIGNWPGVTIEKKSGYLRGTKHEVVDLPGIYSFSPYTLEETVSKNFVLDEQPDLVINIIDATSIERSLYLTTQLLELDCEVIIALNMMDIVEKKGVKIDLLALESELGVKIMRISAKKAQGIPELVEAIKNYQGKRTKQQIFSSEIEQVVANIEEELHCSNKRFVAVHMLDCPTEQDNERLTSSRSELEMKSNMDIEQLIACRRYDYIEQIKANTIVINKVKSVTERIDKIMLHKYMALPIFALIMAFVYFLSVGVVGGATVELISGAVESFQGVLGNWLTSVGASAWAVSLVCDGIVAGCGAILNFLPQLAILFICIGLLESTGYMARIAFVLDRVFRKFGLSGKSLIPFIVGSGCTVPGIMTARTVEDERERRMTVILTPFIPCSAKLPIIALFGGYFFGDYAGLVTISLYLFAVVVILLSAIVIKKIFIKGDVTNFVSELPDYKLPSLKYLGRDVWDKTWAFVKRAGSVIFIASIIVWFLVSFSWKFEYGIDVEKSMLAGVGNSLAWLFYPMLGEWSWGASVSAIQGLIAKEQVISSMAIIGGLAEGASDSAMFSGIFSFFNGASAYAFVVFNLFSAPCFAAISAMRKELGGTKKMLLAVLFQTVLAFLLSYIVFGIGSLIMLI